MTTLRSGSATDIGKVRTTNQDVALEEPDLYAVADGMGGHVGGEVAARVAVDSLRGAFERDSTVEGLRRAVAEANRAVWRQGQSETGLRGMGTTLTAMALVEEVDGRQVIALANVGDSRAYVYSKDQVIQVTADHSLAEEKVRQGQLTEAEAAIHPHRHVLTRALGVSSDVDVDLWELHLHDGDRILLCSDGLTNEIGDERIGQVLRAVPDPSEAAKELVKAALDHGGSDNVTCIVIDVVGAESRASTTPGSAATAPDATEGPGKTSSGAQSGAVPAPEERDGPAGRKASPDAVAENETSNGSRTHGSIRALRSVGGAGPGAPPRSASLRAGRATGSAAAGVGPGDRADLTAAVRVPETRDTANGGVAQGAGHEPGNAALASSRLQAAELRRLQPTRDERHYRRRAHGAPRLITVRLVLFVLLLLGVVAAAYFGLRWYAMDDWYVGIDHGRLAVYQGRPGGFLWFKPQLVDKTRVTTHEVLPFRRHELRADPQEASLRDAKNYVKDLYTEYVSTRIPSGGTSSAHRTQGSTPAHKGAKTSTFTSAFSAPAGVWQ